MHPKYLTHLEAIRYVVYNSCFNFLFTKTLKIYVRVIKFGDEIYHYIELQIKIYSLFYDVIAELQGCVLQIIWSEMCRTNYSSFRHGYKVTR